MVRIEAAESGHRPDRRLERFPARPKKGLVIEARRHERRDCVEERDAVFRCARNRVDRTHGEVVAERLGGCAEVRRGPARAGHIDDRIRLLGPGAPDSARTMILEAAAEHPDAAGEKRRGDAVALEADMRPAVESERERPAAIDRAALRQTDCAHDAELAEDLLARDLLPSTALVAVSRVIANDSMQVRCSQISSLSPLGW